MYRAVLIVGVMLTWLVPAGLGHAGLLFELALGGTTQSSFQIAGPGKTVDIQVYLSQHTVDLGEPDLSVEGLSDVGIKVAFDNPSGIAEVAADSHISANSAEFDFDQFAAVILPPMVPSPPSTLYSAELFESASSAVLPTNGRIFLGTFTFTGLMPGTTTISVTEWDSGYMVTGLGNPLDGLVDPGSATLTVTPEPSSVALSLLMVGAASVVSTYRSRRRRKQLATHVGGPPEGLSL